MSAFCLYFFVTFHGQAEDSCTAHRHRDGRGQRQGSTFHGQGQVFHALAAGPAQNVHDLFFFGLWQTDQQWTEDKQRQLLEILNPQK